MTQRLCLNVEQALQFARLPMHPESVDSIVEGANMVKNSPMPDAHIYLTVWMYEKDHSTAIRLRIGKEI